MEIIILHCVLEVANDNRGRLLVNGFEVSEQGKKCLFKVFYVVVVRINRRSVVWYGC